MTSFAVEVIADNSGEWCGNGVRYPNHADAEAAAIDLSMRWTAVRNWRVVESDDEPNREVAS